MTTIKIHDLPDDLLSRLGTRAAEHDRSVDAEAREILVESLTASTDSSWVDILLDAGNRAGRPDLMAYVPVRSAARIPDFKAPEAS